MKKQLTVALGLAVLATPAFASKARLQALGEDVNGSFYIRDNRNVFLNAAEINNVGDQVTVEWGSGATTDGDTTPNAEGGFYKSHGNFNYGVHFGRVSDFNAAVGDSGFQGTGVSNIFAPSNTLDFFMGGDAGLKWGANLSYATGDNEAFVAEGTDTVEAKGRTLDLNVGAQIGTVMAYVRAGLLGKVEHDKAQGAAVDAEVERKMDIEVGASTTWSGYTIFGQYANAKYDAEVGTDKDDIKNVSYLVGAGRAHKLSDRTNLFTKVQYQHSVFDQDTETDKEKLTAVPVTIGLETEATSWLSLRASISQFVWSKFDDGSEGTVQNTTNVNAGASLKFGDIVVDGVIGTSNNGSVTDTVSENGSLSTDNLMTRVSMTYRF
jgi:hypothetical protein